MARSSSAWTRRLLTSVTAVTTAIGVSLCTVTLLTLESDGGVQWSPDRWCHRSYFHRRALWGALDLSTTYEEWRSPLERWLHAQGVIEERQSQDPRWFTVKSWNGDAVRTDAGEMKWLCHAFGCYKNREGSATWVAWSEANSELANAVFVDVIELARRDPSYAAEGIPSALRRVRDVPSPTPLVWKRILEEECGQ